MHGRAAAGWRAPFRGVTEFAHAVPRKGSLLGLVPQAEVRLVTTRGHGNAALDGISNLRAEQRSQVTKTRALLHLRYAHRWAVLLLLFNEGSGVLAEEINRGEFGEFNSGRRVLRVWVGVVEHVWCQVHGVRRIVRNPLVFPLQLLERRQLAPHFVQICGPLRGRHVVLLRVVLANEGQAALEVLARAEDTQGLEESLADSEAHEV